MINFSCKVIMSRVKNIMMSVGLFLTIYAGTKYGVPFFETSDTRLD